MRVLTGPDDAGAEGTAEPISGSPVLALVYDDGPAFDRTMAAIAADLKRSGLRLAGVAQTNVAREGRTRCDMVLEELSSGSLLTISEDRGSGARGCRLDLDVLARAATLVGRALEGPVDLLVLNKFGKEEAEGRGLRGAMAMAVGRDVPVLVGLPRRNLGAFRAFCGPVATEAEPSPTIVAAWLRARRGNGPA